MTIYEIAEMTGVSISTVSRVLNNPEKVALPTRTRVEEALKQHNYAPSAIARSLTKNSTKIVGILAPDIRNLYFASAAQTLETAFFERGYTSILCCTGGNAESEKDYIQTLAAHKVDGLVLIGSVFSTPKLAKMLQNYMPNVPVAAINGEISGENIYTFSVDHKAGMHIALNHLISRGYENIYFYYASKSDNTLRKKTSFVSEMQKRGLPLHENNNAYFGDGTYDDIQLFAERLAPCVKQHTAVIFHDDISAGYGCKILQQLGYSVPKEIAVLSYDNICTSILISATPQITALDTKIEVLSNLAANTLQSVFTDQPVCHCTSISPELVVRSST